MITQHRLNSPRIAHSAIRSPVAHAYVPSASALPCERVWTVQARVTTYCTRCGRAAWRRRGVAAARLRRQRLRGGRGRRARHAARRAAAACKEAARR
eukprot:6174634-Pleurochrysis_carterae.AAC.2